MRAIPPWGPSLRLSDLVRHITSLWYCPPGQSLKLIFQIPYFQTAYSETFFSLSKVHGSSSNDGQVSQPADILFSQGIYREEKKSEIVVKEGSVVLKVWMCEGQGSKRGKNGLFWLENADFIEFMVQISWMKSGGGRGLEGRKKRPADFFKKIYRSLISLWNM